jgi:hypothetical protein
MCAAVVCKPTPLKLAVSIAHLEQYHRVLSVANVANQEALLRRPEAVSVTHVLAAASRTSTIRHASCVNQATSLAVWSNAKSARSTSIRVKPEHVLAVCAVLERK